MTTEAAQATTSNSGSTTTTAPAGVQHAIATHQTPPPATNATPPGTPGYEWTSGLSEELKGYVSTKGFPDVPALVESYRNAEKLLGVPKEKLVRLPDKEDAPEWNQVYDKLGRPAKPEDYKYDVPQGTDPEFYNWAKENFHKAGLTQKQAQTLLKEYGDLSASKANAQQEAWDNQLKTQEATLKKEWGAALTQNIGVAREAVKKYGFTPDHIEKLEGIMGYDGVMKFFHKLGSATGEGSFVGSTGPVGFGNALTPAQAKYQIKALMSDPDFGSKLANGNLEAKQKWDNLHRMAVSE